MTSRDEGAWRINSDLGVLCDDEGCARKKGMLSPFGKHGFVIEDFAAQLVGLVRESAVKTCAHCALSLAEFQATGMLGCPQCYLHFAPILAPMLKRIHGSDQHIGKSYRKTIRPLPPTQELAKLKLELREAVAEENFEDAATLRDQIKELERVMVRGNP